MKVLLVLCCSAVLCFGASVRSNGEIAVNAATACVPDECLPENNCRCSSIINPQSDGPQLITLTVDESIAANIVDDFWSKLLFDRKNPDGAPISGTFYVPHEYTDYSRVKDLYARGFEIAVHSITKNPLQSYWKNATLETLVGEFGGQRDIISNFAAIPKEDIIGARTPQFLLAGDLTMEAYSQSGIVYDNSWPTHNNYPFYPYTLDYLSTESCDQTYKCPINTWNGTWVIPIINLLGQERECNTLVSCDVEGKADEIAAWLQGQIDAFRNGNRAPVTLVLNSSWFSFTENSYEALQKVLDYLGSLNDVFLVSHSQVIEYMKKPVPLSEFKTKTYDRSNDCKKTSCDLLNANGNQRYMVSCVPCPKNYPWLGNPLGQ